MGVFHEARGGVRANGAVARGGKEWANGPMVVVQNSSQSAVVFGPKGRLGSNRVLIASKISLSGAPLAPNAVATGGGAPGGRRAKCFWGRVCRTCVALRRIYIGRTSNGGGESCRGLGA